MAARYHTMDELLELFPNNPTVLDAVIKTEDHINRIARTGGKIIVSVSGGSDSDIMLDMFERLGYDGGEVVYVWYDTGLEYDATKRHLEYLENKYGVEIRKFRAEKTVAQAVKKCGVPFLSKHVSLCIDRLQKIDFDFCTDANEPSGKQLSAKKWWLNAFGEESAFNISRNAFLREYIEKYSPPKISNRCCEYAKKRTAKIANKKFNPDLIVTGVRRCEGGARATAYNSCFSYADKNGAAKFRPLFYFTDADKQEYKDFCKVTYSDCYEVWGMRRTGCIGCPFGSRFEEELEFAKKYESKLYKTALAIFGESYEYTRGYRAFKEKMKAEKKKKNCCIVEGQESLF